MKNKILVVFIMIFIILSATIITAGIFANNSKLLNKSRISSVEKAYEEIKSIDDTSKLIYVDIANKLLFNFGINDNISKTSSEIKQFKNNLINRKEFGVFSNNCIVKFDEDTQELISYVSNKTNFKKNTLTDHQIKTIANKLFNKIKINDLKKYKLVSLIRFDEEIYSVKFAKTYGVLVNYAESINFSFAPSEERIITLAVNNTKYADNEIKISEQEAVEIASKYVNTNKDYKLDIYIDIVRPNYMYEEALDSEGMYTTIIEMRKAYVITLNNKSNTQIYVDCTTGEVIGGDAILGGGL